MVQSRHHPVIADFIELFINNFRNSPTATVPEDLDYSKLWSDSNTFANRIVFREDLVAKYKPSAIAAVCMDLAEGFDGAVVLHSFFFIMEAHSIFNRGHDSGHHFLRLRGRGLHRPCISDPQR